MGGANDLKEQHRYNARSADSASTSTSVNTPTDSLDAQVEAATPPVLLEAEYARLDVSASHPGLPRRMLYEAFRQTLGRLYTPLSSPQEFLSPSQDYLAESSLESLDDAVERAVGEYQREAQGEAQGEVQSEAQRKAKGSRLNFLLTGREEAIALSSAGVALMGYEIVRHGSGLLHEVSVRGYPLVQPLVEIVSQHPAAAVGGVILTPAVVGRYLRSRDGRLSRTGFVVTALAGTALGGGVGEYGPAIVSGAGDAAHLVYEFAANHALQVALGTAGGLVGGVGTPLVLRRNLRREDGSWNKGAVALTSLLGAGAGVGISLLSSAVKSAEAVGPELGYGMSSTGTGFWPAIQSLGHTLAGYTLPAIACLAGTFAGYKGMSVLLPNASRPVRIAGSFVGGGLALAAVEYGPRFFDGTVSLASRVDPSWSAFTQAVPALVAVFAGVAITEEMFRPLYRHIEGRVGRETARLTLGVAGGSIMAALYHYSSTAAVAAVAAGILGALLTHQKTRHVLGNYLGIPFRYAGRGIAKGYTWAAIPENRTKVWRGATLSARAATFPVRVAVGGLEKITQAVAPNPEFVQRHRWMYRGGVAAAGTTLLASAASLEPVQGAVFRGSWTETAVAVGLVAGYALLSYLLEKDSDNHSS